jgi:hypothetical protein
MPRLSLVKKCTRSALAVREISCRHGSFHEHGSQGLAVFPGEWPSLVTTAIGAWPVPVELA